MNFNIGPVRCVVLVFATIVCFAGCRPKTAHDSKSDSITASNNDAGNRHPMEQHLIGKWRGPVEIDEQAFARALKSNGATQLRVDALLRMKGSFISEVTLTSNGRFRNRVVMGTEVFLPGDTEAPWRVLKSTKNELVVQTYEGADADRWIAEFSDKDTMFFKAPAPAGDGIVGYRLKRVE